MAGPVAPLELPVDNLTPGTIASPLVDPNAWDTITVSGMTVGPKDGSGYVRLRRAGRPYKWQIKDAAGQDGGVSTYRGKKPPEWEIEFHLWTDAHFVAWQALSTSAFLYDPSKTTIDPVDVYHPGLAMVGISQILVDELGVPEQQGDRKMWIATVKCHEYFPPIAANVTQSPTGSAGPTSPNAPGDTPDPNADLQKAIAAQQQQNENDGTLSTATSGLP
jgi:hypothetical protein